MTGRTDDAQRLTKLYLAKAKAELKSADAALGAPVKVAGSGRMLGAVVLVKGVPDPLERAQRRALVGADGVAAEKALAALGFPANDWWAVCSRPTDAPTGAPARARRLELIVEAVDPVLAIALDREAAEDLAAAFGREALPAGQPVVVRGRALCAVGGLAASLNDPAAKARVWKDFKAAAEALPRPVTKG